jgi:hypothetical protein
MDIAKAVALTAVGGLVVGAVGCGGDNKEASTPGASGEAASPSASAVGSQACCKALNHCKGQGGCSTDKHKCGGLNDCHGQGGCKHHKLEDGKTPDPACP